MTDGDKMDYAIKLLALNVPDRLQGELQEWTENSPVFSVVDFVAESDMFSVMSRVVHAEALLYYIEDEECLKNLMLLLHHYKASLALIPFLVIGPKIEETILCDLFDFGVGAYCQEDQLSPFFLTQSFVPLYLMTQRLSAYHHQHHASQMEASLAHKANKDKSDFIARTSHELRTPLNAIMGFSQIMEEGTFGPLGNEKYYGYARDIYQSGQYLLDLIGDVMDLSRIETGHVILEEGEYAPYELISSALGLIEAKAATKRIVIESDIRLPNVDIFVDKRVFTQILINFLSNALKFTPEEGKIKVLAHITPEGELDIVVQDTGIGMSPDDLKKVMTPYYQVQRKTYRGSEGAGLGLSIVKNLAEAMQGRIWIESRLDVGTKAGFQLPETRVRPHKESLLPWNVKCVNEG